MRRMIALTYAVSVSLPGGTALTSGYTFKRLRSWGATVPAAGFTLVAPGILSTLSFALLAIAAALLAGSNAVSSALVIGAAVAAGVTLISRGATTRPTSWSASPGARCNGPTGSCAALLKPAWPPCAGPSATCRGSNLEAGTGWPGSAQQN